MPILHIRHLTTYRYRKPVGIGEHRMMMRPRESYDQRVLAARLLIAPEPVSLRYVHDVFGNCVGFARFDRPAETLSFESRVTLEHHPTPLSTETEDAIGPAGPAFPFAYGPDDMPDLLRSIERVHADPTGSVAVWARRFLRWNGTTPVMALLADMTRAIHGQFRYEARLADGTQTPAQTVALGKGTCRDFAVLMIDAVRSLGLAARFVSGYIYSPPPSSGVARTGGGHTHAWVQVYLPSCGWVEFDPTNGIIGNQDLIRVAVVRDPGQAAPLSGVWDGELEDYIGMTVEVDLKAQPVSTARVA